MTITKVSPDLLDLDAGITISVADNSDTLTLTSTDDDATSGPVLNLYRNSASAADGDILGLIKFTGNSGGSGVHNYGQIRMENNGVTDNQEQGKLIFEVSMTDGTLSKAFNVGRTEISVNEDSKDLDFRVESDAATHAFFVEGSSSRVGIGQSSPDSVLHVKGSSDTVLTMEGGASDANCRINFQNSGGTFRGMLSYDTDDNNLQFNVNDAERMRITSAGVLSIGDASPESGDASAPTSLYLQGGEANMIIKNTDATSSSQRQGIAFLNSSGTRVGTITITSSATGYATSSDYRLKENVDYTWDATTRLKQLKPARFNWIADDTNTLVDGFLAHEVSNVVPEAVIGDKDEIETKTKLVYDSNDILLAENIEESDWTDGKSDGTYPNDSTWVASKDFNIHQGIDQSKLIPLLVKTIQELEARITTLEG